jgi:hypothetical protein
LLRPFSDTADASGRFALRRVRGGSYTLTLAHPEFIKKTFPHELKETEDFDWGEIKLAPRPRVH